MFHLFLKYFFILIIIFNPSIILSDSDDIKKFFSTKYNEVNVRNGPGKNFYVIGKHLKKGLPILIIGEFDNWKRVVNYLGKEGWIASTQLSKKRFGIITKETFLKSFPNLNSKNQLLLKKNVNFKIIKCRKNWCETKIADSTGWLNKKDFWGVFREEVFD